MSLFLTNFCLRKSKFEKVKGYSLWVTENIFCPDGSKVFFPARLWSGKKKQFLVDFGGDDFQSQF